MMNDEGYDMNGLLCRVALAEVAANPMNGRVFSRMQH